MINPGRCIGIFLLLFFGCIQVGYGQMDVKALLDGRTIQTDDTQSWFDGSLGKNRYGGSSAGNRQGKVVLSEAAILVRSTINFSWAAKLYAKYDEEQKNLFDIVEGAFRYKSSPMSRHRFTVKGGAFFPPISLENTQRAWNSPYTVTSSAINSWVAEEMRTIGLESGWEWVGDSLQAGLTFGVFGANDPLGTQLSWRGWSLHNRKTGLFDRIPLAPIPSIEEEGKFESQARWVEPFHEIDDQPGGYLGAHIRFSKRIRLQVLRYDANADTRVFDGTQYAWDTKFTHFGLKAELVKDTHFLSQYLWGTTEMGAGGPIFNYYDAWYVLLSRKFARHRISVRYDQFRVVDQDSTLQDDNNESGWAGVLTYSYLFDSNHKIFVEALVIDSDRDNRVTLGLPSRAVERLFQLSYRANFDFI